MRYTGQYYDTVVVLERCVKQFMRYRLDFRFENSFLALSDHRPTVDGRTPTPPGMYL